MAPKSSWSSPSFSRLSHHFFVIFLLIAGGGSHAILCVGLAGGMLDSEQQNLSNPTTELHPHRCLTKSLEAAFPAACYLDLLLQSFLQAELGWPINYYVVTLALSQGRSASASQILGLHVCATTHSSSISLRATSLSRSPPHPHTSRGAKRERMPLLAQSQSVGHSWYTPLIPESGNQREVNLWEVKGSLVDRVGSGAARASIIETLSQNKTKTDVPIS